MASISFRVSRVFVGARTSKWSEPPVCYEATLPKPIRAVRYVFLRWTLRIH